MNGSHYVHEKWKPWAGKMTQRITVLAPKPDNLSSVSGTHMVDGTNVSLPLTSTHALGLQCTLLPLHIHINVI